MDKNYLVSQSAGLYCERIFVYHKDTHKLYLWICHETDASINYIYDLDNELKFTPYSLKDEVWTQGEYQKYSRDDSVYISGMSEEMRNELLKYLREKYNAEYILPKCIVSPCGSEFLHMYDLQTLSKYRDTGFESLYMISARIAMDKFKPSQWIKLSKSQRKLCINKFRELMSNKTDSKILPNSIKELLEVAEDDSYLLRKHANKRLPDVCKITRSDYDWLLLHKNDTPYGRRKSTTIIAYLKRYAAYLEYEYARERDVTDLYWRHNRNWVDIMRTEQELIREAKQVKADVLIKEFYKDRVLPKLSIDDYEFEVTDDAAKWRKQAKKLHQCIISMQYYKKSSSTIVLCTKNEEPWATFEVNAKGEIIQSYKDEMSADDMKPELACTEACKKYIKEVGLIKK